MEAETERQAFFPNRQFSSCLNPYPDPPANLHPVQYHGQRAHISCVQSLSLTLWPLAVLSGVTTVYTGSPLGACKHSDSSFSASHSDGCLGNRSIASLWSFQEPSCLTAPGFMAPLLLMIHTLSYSASTATWTDRFMGAHTQTPVRPVHRYIDKQGTFLHTQGNIHT